MTFQTEIPCCACGTVYRQRTFHHVYTRKARPDLKDNPRNMMPLCLEHHNMIHAKGTNEMSHKFIGIRMWLVKNGWEFNSSLGKWRLEE